MIKACIFDLDGVIVDTAHYHFLAWQRLARELGYTLTLADNERLKGVSRMESLEIILQLAGKSYTAAEKEAMANRKNEWFVGYIEELKPAEIFPGVKDLITALRGRGVKIALASSSKNARRVVELLNIEALFDALVDGTMIVHTKPDPEIFVLAAKKLGVAPAHCIVVEDAEAGVEAAIRAGMKCVGVGKAEQLRNANRLVNQTADFQLAWLNGI
ncbi:MAG: beta-phosphoglucomutase [Bacteroidota bacterium]